MRKFDLTHDALGFLKALPSKHLRQVVTKTLELMAIRNLTIRRRWLDTSIAARMSASIVYRFDRDFVYAALIGKRNDDDIYKRLGRKA